MLAKGEYLLLSVHDDYHAKMLSREIYEKCESSGFYILSRKAEGENVCAAYQSYDMCKHLFSDLFEVVNYCPQALNSCGNQDLYL